MRHSFAARRHHRTHMLKSGAEAFEDGTPRVAVSATRVPAERAFDFPAAATAVCTERAESRWAQCARR